MKLDNRVVLVTGATGGLGQQFVTQALARGASKVWAAARRDHDWVDPRVVPLRLDVTEPDQVAAAAETAADVDVLINNAGVGGAASLLASPMTDIRATYETNLFGPLELVRAFAPGLIERGGGIIDIHSALSWLAGPGAYSATKTAFWGLTNALRLELAPGGVQVLGAHLGYTDTPLIAHLDVEKSDPAIIVGRILDDFEAGSDESIADRTSTRVREALSSATTGRAT